MSNMKEIKFKIYDPLETEERILRLGGSYLDTINAVDTYFNQPEDKVLKIYEDERESYLIELEPNSFEGFDYIQKCKLDDVEKEKKELNDEFGVHKVLKKVKRRFNYSDHQIYINTIEGLGDFVIIFYESEIPDNINIIEDLCIERSEQITVPFSKL